MTKAERARQMAWRFKVIASAHRILVRHGMNGSPRNQKHRLHASSTLSSWQLLLKGYSRAAWERLRGADAYVGDEEGTVAVVV